MGVLRKTLQVQEAEENRITITGPFKMKSAGGDGTILTETLFCTHLGVSVPNHTLTMIGDGKDVPPETYESWGFVMGKFGGPFFLWLCSGELKDINICLTHTLFSLFSHSIRICELATHG